MTQELRMTLTAGTAVVLTSAVLFPLFISSTWFFAGIGAVITVGAAGLLSRRRTLPPSVCLLITLVALVLYLNLVFEARRSWALVLPTPGSMSGLWRLMRDGFDESRRFAPPAPGVAGLTLLATMGVGITAVMTDLIAVRLRSVALAGLPLLVLFTVPSTFNASRGPLGTGVIFFLGTIGYLSMLSADGRERIRIWGRLVSLWRTHEGAPRDAVAAETEGSGLLRARSRYQVLRGPDTRALAAAARRVGFASILLALCAPLLVPGLHAARLTSTTWVFGPGGGGAGLPDPLSQTGLALQESKPKTVFSYTTTAPAALRASNPQYLQQYVMTLTEGGWQIGTGNGITTTPFNTQLPPQAPGINNAGSPLVTAAITYPGQSGQSSDATVFLPAPFPAVRVYVSGSWQVEPETLMLVGPKTSTSGLTYQVVSRDVNPSPAALRALQVPTGMDKYTQLPVAYKESRQLLDVAERITNGKTTVFDKAEALSQYLNHNGRYSLYGPALSDPQNLLSFLTRNMTGDCVQYAEASTILLRMLGIPARLAVGYTQGTEQPALSGHYVVRDSDAHAWPEVFFAGYGWVRFEPTPPGQGTATAPGFENTPASTGPSTITPTAPAGQTGTPGHGGNGLAARKIIGLVGGDAGAGGSQFSAKKHTGAPWTAIALAVLAAIALACGIIAMVAPASRRLLAARPGSAAERIGRVNIGGVLIAVGISAGVVALALYRMLSRTSGLNLGAGWATVGIAFGAAAFAALALPTLCRAVLRRWRWVRASDDEAKAHAAWLELCADLADYGIGYSPSESPRAVAHRVRSGLALAEPAAEAVGRIALAEEHASYAGRLPESPETLHKDGTAARRGIARAAGQSARWRARIFPASTMTTLSDAATRLSDLWRRLTTRNRSR